MKISSYSLTQLIEYKWFRMKMFRKEDIFSHHGCVTWQTIFCKCVYQDEQISNNPCLFGCELWAILTWVLFTIWKLLSDGKEDHSSYRSNYSFGWACIEWLGHHVQPTCVNERSFSCSVCVCVCSFFFFV